MSRTRLLAGIGIAALVGLLLWGTLGSTRGSNAPARTIDEHLARGESAAVPALSLRVLERGSPGGFAGVWDRAARDGRVSLTELRGVPVLVNFWASWCDPCQREAPRLRDGWREADRSGVLFVGINTQDKRDDAINFDGYYRLTYPNLVDQRGTSLDSFRATGLPETYFLDRRGRIVAHVVGEMSRGELRAGTAAAQGGDVISPLR